MSDILEKILVHKRNEIAQAKQRVPMSALEKQIKEQPPTRGFAAALKNENEITVIAELKKASPSARLIRADFDANAISRSYAQNGAAALSVLTDEKFFQGRLKYLQQAKKVCELPILRKDFIIDPYQIIEARTNGADAILLIVAALEPAQLRELLAAAKEYHLDVLVEAHDENEIETALANGATIIGVNNRDLKTFEVTLKTSERLMPLIPNDCIKVAESGIHHRRDVERLAECGIDAVLVGSHLMKQNDVATALKKLTGVRRT